MAHAKRKKAGKPIRRPKLAKDRHSSAKRVGLLRVPASLDHAWELNEEQVTLIKNTVAKGATDDELKLFLTTARRHRLDPFTHQIWFVRRWDRNADSGKRTPTGEAILGAYVGVTQVGIDGFLHVASRDHKDFGSISLPEYGPMVQNHPEWARVTVYKKGLSQPTVAQAWWDEYAPTDMTKAPFWRKMPRRMLAKCATALALRQAYPDLSGVYIPEETQRMEGTYTPAGRPITDGSEADNPYLNIYLEREREEMARYTPEQREVLEAKMKPAGADPPKADGATVPAQPAPIPALFYVFVEQSQTYRIDGPQELKSAHKDLLAPLYSKVANGIVASPEQLGRLISQFENRKVPFRELKSVREPGGDG